MRRLLAGLTMLGLVLVSACTAAGEQSGPEPTGSAAVSSGPESSTAAPPPTTSSASPTRTPSTTPTPTPTPSEPPDPVSIEALIQKDYNGRDLRIERELDADGPYRRYIVTFVSEDLRVSGVMNVPTGKGPFPVLVLNHGYIDPAVYKPGQGMAREQDYLARNGYVVLHVDYRGHASSDDDPDVDYELRLPYAVDTINAVQAVKSSDLEQLDGERVGWMGRSMGGNVTLAALVARPGLVDAAAIWASTSSLAAENWETFYDGSGDRRAVNRKIDQTYGLPDDSPDFWKAASPQSYLDRVTEPLLVVHGEQDDTCPVEWSEETAEVLEKADKDVTLSLYANEGHTFYNRFDDAIDETATFFARHLG